MTVNLARVAHRLSQSELVLPHQVRKRDGARTTFDLGRLERAVAACFASLDVEPVTPVATIVSAVATSVASRFGSQVPSVEQVQDLVEVTLLSHGEIEAARHYISYRDAHAKRRSTVAVPQEVQDAFDVDATYFDTPAQRFTFYDKYSRFNWDLMRRETWPETVARTVDHLKWEVAQHLLASPDTYQGCEGITQSDWERIHNAILTMRVMPSMRLLAMAGEAAQRNSMATYNCTYLPVSDIYSYVEAMLISMAGAGVGFSVERDYVEQFPRIARQTGTVLPTHVIADSTEGWGEALHTGLVTWWAGSDISFDASEVRPAGAVLKIKGGRASGALPLLNMLDFLRTTILSRQGTFLRTTDAHLMMCAVGDAAVQGGVRRTAMISLFDWDDHAMRTIKSGPNMNPLLYNANNSAVWPSDISDTDIAQQMLDMVVSYSGEPGIFSRDNANNSRPARRKAARWGTNPCGEIILKPRSSCNLSQAVCRLGDTVDDLYDKVEIATIVGVIQSLSTRFPGLRDEWKRNAEEERLVGVDLTAQADCELLQVASPQGEALRAALKQHSVDTGARYAGYLGINAPAANTTNKPAGNSAELLNASNGIHRRHAPYYMRRMLVSSHSPLFRVLRDANVPMEPRVGSTTQTATSWVVTFPKASPPGAVVKGDVGAVAQCEFWLLNKEFWTEHSPSCTITYRPDEVIDLISWVCKHKDKISGLSFFPTSDAVYAQQPFEEITEAEYDDLEAAFPEIDFSLVYAYESTDMTTAAQELACFAGDGTCAL